jgi:hypothetical protein
MAVLPIQRNGLVLGAIPATNGAGKGAHHGLQAMRISFADGDVLEEVLKNSSELKITCGKSMVRATPSLRILSLVSIVR